MLSDHKSGSRLSDIGGSSKGSPGEEKALEIPLGDGQKLEVKLSIIEPSKRAERDSGLTREAFVSCSSVRRAPTEAEMKKALFKLMTYQLSLEGESGCSESVAAAAEDDGPEVVLQGSELG